MSICPTCERESLVFTTINGVHYCPACAPVPDRKPHDYKYATGGVVKSTDPIIDDARGRPLTGCDPRLVLAYVRNDVCCLDPGDCSGPCGIARE